MFEYSLFNAHMHAGHQVRRRRSGRVGKGAAAQHVYHYVDPSSMWREEKEDGDEKTLAFDSLACREMRTSPLRPWPPLLAR